MRIGKYAIISNIREPTDTRFLYYTITPNFIIAPKDVCLSILEKGVTETVDLNIQQSKPHKYSTKIYISYTPLLNASINEFGVILTISMPPI